MNKKYKCILLYGFVLLICIALIIVIGWVANKKIDDFETTHQKMLEEREETLKILEQEKAELKKENKELQTKLTQAMSEKSDITTNGQALADLINIYELYKSGKESDAVKKLKKIEPMGFDDATLAYYEILKDILER